jgi:hypothetical protein
MNPLNILNVVGFIKDLYTARQEHKANVEIAKAAVKQASIEGQTQLELTSAQWEALAVAQTANSWKDEYVTIVITSPIALLLLGGLVGAFTGDTSVLVGVSTGIAAIEAVGVDMGFLMSAVTLAAIGLKFIRK